MTIPEFILLAVALYLLVGMCVALPFAAWGVSTVDHAARGAPWSFRLLIFPGCVALWPVVIAKWRAVSTKRGDPR